MCQIIYKTVNKMDFIFLNRIWQESFWKKVNRSWSLGKLELTTVWHVESNFSWRATDLHLKVSVVNKQRQCFIKKCLFIIKLSYCKSNSNPICYHCIHFHKYIRYYMYWLTPHFTYSQNNLDQSYKVNTIIQTTESLTQGLLSDDNRLV